jgi:hypothetical protein
MPAKEGRSVNNVIDLIYSKERERFEATCPYHDP